jgi:O-succinylbenzoic acid--CoA ligase
MTFSISNNGIRYFAEDLNLLAAPWRRWCLESSSKVLLIPVGHDFDSILRLYAAIFSGQIFCPVNMSATPRERAAYSEALRHLGQTDEMPLSLVGGGSVPTRQPNDFVIFTSGSSGEPKGIIHRWENAVAAAKGFREAHSLSERDSWLLSLPLYHISGFSVLVRAIETGHGIFVARDRSVSTIADSLVNGSITGVSLVPTQLREILNEQRGFTKCRVLVGGAPFSSQLRESANKRGLLVSESYGATETCAQIINDGIPFLGVQWSRDLSGEFLVKGPMVADKYVTAAGVFSNLDAEGFWHSGDIIESYKRLRVTGRLKDLINSGGVKVSPAEVEGAILEHPLVSNAAVFGVPDDHWGERVVALAVSRGDVKEAEIIEFLRTRISREKVPKEIRFVSSIPEVKLGKKNRALLADQFRVLQ